MVARAPDRRGRSAQRPGTAAEGVLRRARPPAAQRHRQRRQLLAHAGPAHAPDDKRLARRADRAGCLRAGRGPGSRGAARAQRVPSRGRQHFRRAGGAAPGLVVVGPQDEVELITPPARELLASLRPDRPAYADDAMATPVLALASFVRGAPEAGQAGSNVVTVPGSDGWITLHASLPGPPGDGRIAVVLERAGGARSATVRLEAFGATAREREVATLLARGLSRAEIAESLVLSPHTVEDHTKSLYDKVGVASRQELVARVFLDEYLPEVAQSTPLTSRGRFDHV